MTLASPPTRTEPRIHLFQGDYVVTADPATVVTTILGSCVAACVRDPVASVGGINHFLLPGTLASRPDDSLAAGVHLMELLINGLLSRGARRDRLEAKLFGGARTVRGLSDIGAQNIAFAQDFLKREGITIGRGSVGGLQGRRIEFWPALGRIRQHMIPESAVAEEPVRHISVCVKSNAGEVDLF